MANIITARQAFKQDGGANIANCPTLKHAIVAYGKQGLLVDYVTGLHLSGVFTAHGDGWSTANTEVGTAVTAGSWFTPGTANFCAHVVAKFSATNGVFQIGSTFSNGSICIGVSGHVAAEIGSVQQVNAGIEVGVANGYTLSRLGADALEARKNGVVVDSVTGDPGNIATIAATIGIPSCTEFYGAFVFHFSGAVPSNYAEVLNEITTRRLAGDWRLPIEIEDWT